MDVARIVGRGARLDEATSKGYPIGSFGRGFPAKLEALRDLTAWLASPLLNLKIGPKVRIKARLKLKPLLG